MNHGGLLKPNSLNEVAGFLMLSITGVVPTVLHLDPVFYSFKQVQVINDLRVLLCSLHNLLCVPNFTFLNSCDVAQVFG